MIFRVLTRLAIVWAVVLIGWAAILSANTPGIMAHGGWTWVLVLALAPLAAVGVLMWVFKRPG